jgi:RNA-directed DNA polymerase
MWVKPDRRIFAHSFQPAASPKALTRISRDIRSWALHHRSDKSLTELAQMYNPCIRNGHQTKGARDWFDRLRRANPTLFAHWALCHGNGRTSGAV